MPALTFPLAGTLSRGLNVTRRWPVAGGANPGDYGPVVFYDFTDITTMSQVYNANVPVTAVDDPIGHIDDLSGGGFYAAQQTSAARPLLKQDGNNFYCVRTDGIDDTLNGTMPGSAKKTATVFTAYRVLSASGTANGVFLTAASDSDAGHIELYQYNPSGLHYTSTQGTAQLQGGVTVSATGPSIVTQRIDLTTGSDNAASMKIRVNGVAQSPSYLGGPPGSASLFYSQSTTFGAMSFGNFKSNTDFYVHIVYDYILSDAECAEVEAWINARCGAF